MAQEATLRPIVIFGDTSDRLDKGFTGQNVSERKLDLYQFTDVNRALKQVSGVYIREEDGLGLRPNIGLRGTNPDRSKKIVLLEDNVLIGPAPYSAPAAYYTPSLNHVDELEVFKGFSAAHVGPNSVGGAINYLSSKISEATPKQMAQVTYGSFNTVNSKLSSSGPTSFGSYLIEGSYLFSEGFKKIDGGANTEVHKSEVLSKLKWDLNRGAFAQNLEFVFGLSFEDSNETYLGLSKEDFNSSPYRRYSSSALDNMNWDHQKYQIRHNLQVSDTGLIETVAYKNDFTRSWFKVNSFRNPNAATTPSINAILNNPDGQPIYYDILRGELDSASLGPSGQLLLVNNDRTFFSQGVQSTYTDEFNLKFNQKNFLKIEPELFVRAHQDQVSRIQTSDNYEMVDGRLEAVGDPTNIESRNEQLTSALTLSSRANFSFESYIITPLLRLEFVDYEYKDLQNQANNANRTDSAVIPGISMFKRLNGNLSTGVSYNRAASLAGISAAGDEVKETANNYEYLIKYFDQDKLWQADATVFYTDYQNLTGTCTQSGGCTSGTGESFNGGQAEIFGLEAGATKGFFAGAVYIPLGLNFTYLNAKFSSDFASSSPEWGIGDVESGDPLPYIPEYQYTATAGATYKKFSSELAVTTQTKTYDQSVSDDRISIDGFTFVDLAGNYQLKDDLKINYKISNLFDRDYAVAARPFGSRPGQPRALQVGLKYTF